MMSRKNEQLIFDVQINGCINVINGNIVLLVAVVTCCLKGPLMKLFEN